MAEVTSTVINFQDWFLGQNERGKISEGQMWRAPIYGAFPNVRQRIEGAVAECNQHYRFNYIGFHLEHSSREEGNGLLACHGSRSDEGVSITFFNRQIGGPNHFQYLAKLRNQLPGAVAHELGHYARAWEGHSSVLLGEWLVHEAVAMTFQRAVYPDRLIPPVEPTEEQVDQIEERVAALGITCAYQVPWTRNRDWVDGQTGLPKNAVYLLAKGWMDRFQLKVKMPIGEVIGIPTVNYIHAVAPNLLHR